jgi:lipopolysaccharide transport system permease protein
MSPSSPTVTPARAGRRLRIDSRRRWFPDLGAALRARQLVILLNRRDITVRYRQTVLGTVWVFVTPLMSAGLFTFVFGQVAQLPSEGVSYFVFAYAGLVGWNVFSDTVTASSKSLTANSSLITKIYFPRLALPLSTIAATLINTALSLGVMACLLVGFHVGFSFHLVALPLWLFLALVLAMAVGLVLASIAVTFRDINQATPFLVSLLLYLTPVAYSADAVPRNLVQIYRLNPVATIVEGCRWSLLGQANLSAWAIVYTVAVTLVMVVVALVLFARLEWGFADVV